MRALLIVFLACIAQAQTFTTVGWTCSTPTTCEATYLATGPINPYIKWGTSTPSNTYNPNIGASGEPAGYNNKAMAKYELLNLTPSTTYQVQLCHNPGVEVCSVQTAVTTPAAQDEPTLPADSTLPTTPPTVTGDTRTVSGSCLSTTTGLQYWLDNANCGDEIVIPRSVTDCEGAWQISKSCGGGTWLTIHGDGSTIDLPPPGTRVNQATVDLATEAVTLDTSRESSLSQIYLSGFDVSFGIVSDNSNCTASAGTYQAAWNTGNTWNMLARCIPSTTSFVVSSYTQLTTVRITTGSAHGYSVSDKVCISGATGVNANDCYSVSATPTATTLEIQYRGANVTWTGVLGGSPIIRKLIWKHIVPTVFPTTRPPAPPTSCGTPGTWGHYTGAGAAADWYFNAYLCTDGGWRRASVWNPANTGNGILFTSAAQGIYMYGLALTPVAHPRDEPFRLETQVVATGGSITWAVDSVIGSSRIVLDRLLIRAQTHGQGSGVRFNSIDSAIVNSSLLNLAYYQNSKYMTASNYYGDLSDNLTAGGVFVSSGRNSLVKNNIIEAYGLSYHADDTGPNTFQKIENLIIQKNLFYRSPAFWIDSPSSNGITYAQRQVVEFKSGSRVLIDGNMFIGGATISTSNAASITTSPVNSDTVAATCASGVCTFANAAQVASGAIAINDYVDVNGTTLGQATNVTSTTVTLSPAPTNGPVTLKNTRNIGVSDLTVTNNSQAGLPIFIINVGFRSFGGFQPIAGARHTVRNNLLYYLTATRKITPGYTASQTAMQCHYAAQSCRYYNNTIRTMIPDGVVSNATYGWLSSGDNYGLKSSRFVADANIAPFTVRGLFRTYSTIGNPSMTAEYGASGSTFWSHLWTGSTTVADFPASNTWTATSPVQADGSLAIGSVWGPSGASRSVSGLGFGADIPSLRLAQGSIETAVAYATGSGITIRWLCADSPCVAEYSVGGGAYTRVSPTVSGRSQSVEITGTGSYAWRVVCPAATASGTIVR